MLRVFLFLFCIFYLLPGLVTSTILFKHWAMLKGFKKDFIARLVGVFFWPWVLREISSYKGSRIFEKDLLKRRVGRMVSSDRDKGGIRDWVKNYITNPKIDKEAVYRLRIYTSPGRR